MLVWQSRCASILLRSVGLVPVLFPHWLFSMSADDIKRGNLGKALAGYRGLGFGSRLPR